MTARPRIRAASTAYAARLMLAGAALGLGALALPSPAAAQPDVPPVVPGQPGMAADPVPPPAPPPVPQMQNQQYGSGDGPLGFLRDAWHQAQNPYGMGTPDQMPAYTAPPPGAGPPPPLPPGYTSFTAPESSTPALSEGPGAGGPPLPPGYYPLDGPPPPGYFDPPPAPAPGPPPAPPKIIAGQP
ncbi:MAG: hypothetical protein SV966_12305 [Actinomycetota bacterium]|nr:hypothetical protein [Actinomycetota bacterium]